ncbi:MAG: nucleotidyltransferase domain-containing protein [Pseudomonadota bacterium]
MARRIEEVEDIARNAVRMVNNRYPVRAAYLFGSYVDGIPRDDSDIDVAVFAEGVEFEKIDVRMDFISQIQKAVAAEVELHLYSAALLKEMRPTNFAGYISSHGKKIAA